MGLKNSLRSLQAILQNCENKVPRILERTRYLHVLISYTQYLLCTNIDLLVYF